MTEAARPNIFERVGASIHNGWNRLRERLSQGSLDFVANQSLSLGVMAVEAQPRVEEIRNYFDGGVREVARNVGNRIRQGAERFVDWVRGIPESTRGALEDLGSDCKRCGVLPTLASRVGGFVETTCQRVFVDGPASRLENKADFEEKKLLLGLKFMSVADIDDLRPEYMGSIERVVNKLMARSDEMRARAEEIRATRIAKLEEAIAKLGGSSRVTAAAPA